MHLRAVCETLSSSIHAAQTATLIFEQTLFGSCTAFVKNIQPKEFVYGPCSSARFALSLHIS